ncbi:MAG: DUF2806 domain-containing protein [Eubacteriales bacterium]
MEPDKVIEALGKIAEPVNTVVQKISSATGILYEPVHIRKLAKAEADAKLIQLETLLGLSRSEAVSIMRRELIRFENYQGILDKALPLIGTNSDDSFPSDVDADWLRLHYEKSSICSDEEMQLLWAKILAGEFSKPNSFSKQALVIVEQLGKEDAFSFTKFCSCLFEFDGLLAACYFSDQKALKMLGVSYYSVMQLESFGLIKLLSSYMDSIGVESSEPKLNYKYFDISGEIELTKTNSKVETSYSFSFGEAQLTRPGSELAKICGASKNLEYLSYIQRKWNDQIVE